MAPYIYQQLKAPESDHAEFRLLTLHHGEVTDQIRVSIKVQRLPLAEYIESPTPLQWTGWQALSYTWGDVNDVEDISVIDPDSGLALGELSVTTTLIEALRVLRDNNTDRSMWVDAVSINQANDEVALRERAWQVRYMHHIYSKADGVIIWLGAESDDSSYALQILNEIGSSLRVEWGRPTEHWTKEGPGRERMKSLIVDSNASREQRAVRSLLTRPYFERVWVKQEAMLANETSSIVAVGHCTVSLENFRKAVYWYCVVAGIDTHSITAANRLGCALDLCSRNSMSELNLLTSNRRSVCKDPRDKIYGILGIVALRSRSSLFDAIQVDYSGGNTVEKTYLDFFLTFSAKYRTSALLIDSGLSQTRDLRPTWVPDWRVPYEAGVPRSLTEATSEFSGAEYRCYNNERLHVIGKFAADIAHVRVLESSTIESDFVEKVDWYKELALLMRDHLHPLQINSGIEMISRAVAQYQHRMGRELMTMHELVSAFRSYFTALYDAVSNESWNLQHKIPLPKDYMDVGSHYLLRQTIGWFKQNRVPFVFSSDGHIGVGPPGVQIGDDVWAILGCHALMVLRQTGNAVSDRGTHQVVGACFLHGLNWGEALLGPLPQGYTLEARFESSLNMSLTYYVNVESNIVTRWDPRIAWEELEAHPPRINFAYVQAPPGEPLRMQPKTDYLIRHGVEVHSVILV